MPSPDLSKVSPPSSFSSAGTEPAPALVEENSESFYDNNDKSFFPENAKTQESSQEYQDDVEPASFSYANFEQKLGHVKSDFRQNVTAYEEPVFDFRQNLTTYQDPVHVKKPVGLSAELGGSMKKDFDESFNPGFTDFGDFGGQSYARILWGNKKEEK